MKIFFVVMSLLFATASYGQDSQHQQELEEYLRTFDTAVTQLGPLGHMTLNRTSYQPFTAVSMMTPEAMMAMQYWGIQMDMPKAMDLWSQIYFIGDFMNTHDFVNLTPSGKDDQIRLDNFENGFRYKQVRTVDIGIGYSRNVDSPLGTAIGIPMGMDQQMLDMMQDMMADMMQNRQPQQPTNPEGLMKWIMDLRLQAMIGISPIVGSSITADRFVTSKEDVLNLPSLKIPQTKQDLNQLKKGDLISYNTHGGILFNAALAVALPQAPMVSLGVGADYFAQGSWTINLLKIDDHKVMASLNKSTLQSFKLLTFMGAHQVLSLNLENEKFKEVSKKLSFIFDLNDPEVEKLYQEFLVGNVKLIQSRVYQDGITGIVSTTNTRMTAKIKRRGIKLTHFISSSKSKGFMNSFSTKEILTNGVTSKIQASLYIKGKDTRFFSRRKKQQNNFLAFSETRSDLKNDFGGELILTYETNKGKTRHLNRAINRMIKTTGLKKVLNVIIPKSKKLGFAAIELRVKLNKKVTTFLTDLSTLPKGISIVKSISNKFVESNKNSNDTLDVCSMYDNDQSSKDHCFYSFKRRTQKKVRRSLALLEMMKINLKNKNHKYFTKHYAEFGEILLNNAIIFQTYFQLIKEKGLIIDYKILGNRLSFFEKSFTWE